MSSPTPAGEPTIRFQHFSFQRSLLKDSAPPGFKPTLSRFFTSDDPGLSFLPETEFEHRINVGTLEASVSATHLEQRLVSFTMRDTDVGADELTLEFDNFDLSLFENALITPNGSFRVFMGMTDRDRVDFSRVFTVVEWSGLRRLTVRCLSGFEWILNRVKRTESYDESRISDIVRAIAKRNRMRVVVDDTPFAYTRKTQKKQSDAEFLRQLAQEIGFVWYVDETTAFEGKAPARGGNFFDNPGQNPSQVLYTIPVLHFHERKFRQGDGQLRRQSRTYRVGDDPRIISEPNFGVSMGQIFGRLRGQVFDPLQKKFLELSTDLRSADRRVMGSATFINEFSELQFAQTTQDFLSGGEEILGFYKEMERRMVRATMTLHGDFYLRPKRVIIIDGLGSLLSGGYYVDAVTYRFGSSIPFTMKLEVRTNGLNFTADDFNQKLLRLEKINEAFREDIAAAKDAAERLESEEADLITVRAGTGLASDAQTFRTYNVSRPGVSGGLGAAENP